jgi:hypothetical protein
MQSLKIRTSNSRLSLHFQMEWVSRLLPSPFSLAFTPLLHSPCLSTPFLVFPSIIPPYGFLPTQMVKLVCANVDLSIRIDEPVRIDRMHVRTNEFNICGKSSLVCANEGWTRTSLLCLQVKTPVCTSHFTFIYIAFG